MKWTHLMDMLPWRRNPPPSARLEAAIAANEVARHDAQEAEAEFVQTITEHRERAEGTLRDIRSRAARPRRPSPVLVAITDTLKSLERPS